MSISTWKPTTLAPSNKLQYFEDFHGIKTLEAQILGLNTSILEMTQGENLWKIPLNFKAGRTFVAFLGNRQVEAFGVIGDSTQYWRYDMELLGDPPLYMNLDTM